MYISMKILQVSNIICKMKYLVLLRMQFMTMSDSAWLEAWSTWLWMKLWMYIVLMALITIWIRGKSLLDCAADLVLCPNQSTPCKEKFGNSNFFNRQDVANSEGKFCGWQAQVPAFGTTCSNISYWIKESTWFHFTCTESQKLLHVINVCI